ncbi:MAG TPA: hypothetical protein VKU01_14635 [Bryobacteraceae bacterium]|nr:hypothetical protein [Bryobacteraceae bacterium]
MWEQASQALNQSWNRVVRSVAGLLPGIVALIVALLVSFLLAWLLAFLVRQILRSMQFDRRLMESGASGLSDIAPRNSPALLVERAVFWIVILMGLLIGIAAFDTTLTSQLLLRIFSYLPQVAAAVILLIIGNFFAHFLGRSVLIGAVNMNLQYASLLSAGVKWMVLVLAVTMALDHLGIGGGVVNVAFGILFGGIVLALALAVGLGSKDLVSRSLERQSSRRPEEVEEPFQHL